MDPDRILSRLVREAGERIVHREHLPARDPGPPPAIRFASEISARLRRRGIERLWEHQAAGIEALRRRHNVAVATGTASGKSLVYQVATMEALLGEPRATALYLFPTKALAQDQLRSLRGFALPEIRAAVYDGDTPTAERPWVRRNANLVITNPDMLHLGILPAHARWATFLRGLRLVVVDEMHVLRGVFGSHVALVLRRLRRLATRYGADPVFCCASATIGNPAELAERLTGLAFEAVAGDASPRGEKEFLLWNPPVVEPLSGARRGTVAEAADIVAALVRAEVRTIAFARSRKAAELLASFTRDRLAAEAPERAERVAAYRAGYLAEERRALERALVQGDLLAVAATTALELGIDIGGLDACVIAGYPGSVAGTWQQAGRAGRGAGRSLAVLVASEDPLDQYIVTHPETIFGRPHEAAVADPTNPAILDPHLGCAAYELGLSEGDREIFGPALGPAVERLAEAGRLRERGGVWRWAGGRNPAAAVDIRSAGALISIVEQETGTLLGTVDESRARLQVHPGAIYLHQGEQFEVVSLDLAGRVALATPTETDCTTQARHTSDIRILEEEARGRAGVTDLSFGRVEVTSKVVGYVRTRLLTGEVLESAPLDLPEDRLETRAMWFTVPDPLLDTAGLDPAEVPGAAHAAEHAAIGLMPLFALCDRWDIGGVSTALHEDTGACTIFIYDGYPGGVGIAERAFETGERLLRATMEAIAGCGCTTGCPGCVQSPKCGNGNEPLDKAGAARLIAAVLGEPGAGPGPGGSAAVGPAAGPGPAGSAAVGPAAGPARERTRGRAARRGR